MVLAGSGPGAVGRAIIACRQARRAGAPHRSPCRSCWHGSRFARAWLSDGSATGG